MVQQEHPRDLATETTIKLPRRFTAGEVVAVDVDESTYMEMYAESFHEWVDGVVTKMSPVTLKHNNLTGYLYELLRAYFHLKPIGLVVTEPFVMRLETVKSRREPDLQVILNTSKERLTETYMDGPADIVIEVVSAATMRVDYGEKLEEYEQGGAPEYWLLNPLRSESFFRRLNRDGEYQLVPLDTHDNYTTPLLPNFKLHVPMLWQDDLPGLGDVWAMVK